MLIKNKIIVVGSVSIDTVIYSNIIPVGGETVIGDRLLLNIGGKGANQAFSAHFLKAPVKFYCCLGNDENASKIQIFFCKNRLNYQSCGTKNATGSAHIWCDNKTKENRIIILPGANTSFSKKYCEEIIKDINKDDILLLQLEINLDAVNYLINKAKEKGATIILNPAPYKPLLKDIFSKIDFFTPNEHELDSFIPGNMSYLEKAKKLIDLGIKNVIVTLGEKGSMFVNKEENFIIPAKKVVVKDTTAAGDSYCGAFACKYLLNKDIKECMEFATLASSYTVSKEGAIISLPKLKDLKK